MTREELQKRILEVRYNLVSAKDKEFIDVLEKLAIQALKQEPILKIRAEIEQKYGGFDICERFGDYDYEESKYRQIGKVSHILAIIDKYRKGN